jgi:hypothetical protein
MAAKAAMIISVDSFRMSRNPSKIEAKRRDHCPQADFSSLIPLPVASDYFRFADNSELFAGAGNLIPPLVRPRSPPAGTIVKSS